ncbi:phage tail protein [Enterococcus italicus]
MRIYIRDQNDAVLDVLDDTYYDLSIEDFLKGKATVLSFSMVKDEMSYKLITTGKNLSFVYDDEEYWLTCMIVEQDEYYLSVTAWSIGLEYNNETIGPYKSPKAMTFVEYLNVIDFEKVLTVGINEVSDKKISYEWTGTDKKLARLYSLANVFGAEIAFVTRLNDDGSLKQIVINVYHEHDDDYQGVGNDRRNETFYFGEEIKTIKKTEDKTGLYTAITATGKDGLTIAAIDREVKDENGLVLYKTVSKATADYPDVNKIYAVQARLQFPSTVKGSDRWTVNNAGETEYSSAEALYGYMLSQLKENSIPKTTWEIEGNIKAKIGDTVRIADEGYKPTLYLEARVTGKVRKPDNAEQETTTFSNVKELQSQVDQSLLDRVNALIERTKPYTLSLVSDNGVTFKNSEGKTTLSAIVYNGTQVITPDVTVRWYKDDVWVKTGYSLTVNASDIIDKAVYRAEVMDTNGVIRAKAEVTVFNVDDGKGIKGKPVLSYAGSASIDTVPTTWQATIPNVPAGSYLWTREVTTYTDDTTSEVITPVLMGPQGDKGDKGDSGRGIIDSNQEWAASTSGTTAPTTWQTAIPTVSAGQYLWSKVTETWSDNTHTYRFTIGKIGENGQNAQMMFLSADKNTMMFNADNTAKFAQTATITAKYQNVSGTVAFTAKGIKADGTSEALTLTGSGDSRTVTSAMFKTNWVMITVTATLAGLTDTLSIIKVNDGAQGIGGAKGYFHSAWAMSADGRTGFSTTVSEGKWYIGTYFDFVEADSTDPTRYNWLELAGAVNMYIAYAWSQDGTDRFTRVKPNENLLVGAVVFGNITGDRGANINWNQPFLYRTENYTNVKAGQSYQVTVYNRKATSSYDQIEKIVQYKDDGTFISSIERLYVDTYKYVPASNVGKIKIVYRLSEDGINTFISNPKNDKGLKIELDRKSMYTPAPVDDYDNAVPRYIGRSLKDSTNPADFTWEPNPERKPWVSYAQGLNGEGLSLMPYGENLLPNTSTDMTIASSSSSDNFRYNKLPAVLQPYTSYTFSSDVVLTGNGNGEPNKVSVLVYTPDTVNCINGTNNFIANNGRFSWSFTTDSREARLLIYAGQQAKTGGYKAVYRKSKLELANTMEIPTPWSPAPSEDPLGAIPKYVGTAALPYEDWAKYTWDLNPSWLQQESNNNLATKVDNNTYNNERSNVWTEISNRVTKEEAQAIQKSLDRITGAYTDFVSTGGKHDQDLANLKRAINTDIQKLADKVLGFDFVNTWFRIGDGGLSIGEANSNFEILISNDQITFYDSGTAVAYVSNQSFFINSGMIVDDLQIGKFKMVAINDNLMGLFHIA